jgi:hypothetical protein
MLKAKTNSVNRKLLAVLLSLALVGSLFSGLGFTASAEPVSEPVALNAESGYVPEYYESWLESSQFTQDEKADLRARAAIEAANVTATAAEPVSIGPGYHIVTGGDYTLDATARSGVIYVDTSAPVTIIGNGAGPNDAANTALTIDATVAGTGTGATGAHLTLQDVWISSQYQYGNVLNFAGTGNVLTSTGRNILENNTNSDGATVHVGSGTELTIIDTSAEDSQDDHGLYVYTTVFSAGIGGDENTPSGKINFTGGKVYVKTSQAGAAIGGDSIAAVNDDITISGGYLSVMTNARGAGIGASNQGECAGDVYITGGSVRIDVNFDGSAIGRGASGRTVGNLYYTGGSVEVYVQQIAAQYWGNVSGSNNRAITAEKFYGIGTSAVRAQFADFNLANTSIAPTARITAVMDATDTLYDEQGFNQKSWDPNYITTYTPSNWVYDAGNTLLSLALPISPGSGEVVISDDQGHSQTYRYSYNASSGQFDVATAAVNVSFAAPNATVYVNGTPVTGPVSVPQGGSLSFYVLPASGYAVTGPVTATAGTVSDDTGGYYTLASVGANSTVTVPIDAGDTYVVTFTGRNETTMIGSNAVTQANVSGGEAVNFRVIPNAGYGVASVTASPSGTITIVDSRNFTLSGVSANTAVTVLASNSYTTVTFNTPYTWILTDGAYISGNTVRVPTNGILSFSAVPYVGYAAPASATLNGSTVINANAQGVFNVANVPANSTVSITPAPLNDYWTSSVAPNFGGGSGTILDPFQINAPEELAKLMTDVNAGTTYEGVYFILMRPIDLTGRMWAPIGGAAPIHNETFISAATPAFKGTLDAGNNTILGLDIVPDAIYDGFGGFGLFGYVNGGTLQNVSLTGAINMSALNTVSAAAGVVGYLSGSVYHAITGVNVSANIPNGTDIGGVAGLVYGSSGSQLYISLSGNVGSITGRSEVGGIAGSVYTPVNGGVIIDQCYNDGNIVYATPAQAGTAYIGGVVGYDTGYIQNSYNTGNVIVGATGNYVNAGGIAGLLNGTNSSYGVGSLSDSFNNGDVTGSGPNVVLMSLWADNDNSPNVTVSNVVFNSDIGPGQSALGATVTDMYGVTTAQMASSAVIGQGYLSPDYFAYVSGDNNPRLLWQNAAQPIGPIYVDPAAAGGSPNGTVGNPYPNLAGASQALSFLRDVVFVTGTVTVSDGQTVDPGPSVPNARIFRGPGFEGTLINVAASGNLTLANITVDGRTSSGNPATGPLVTVDGGVFSLFEYAALANNITASSGAAINMTSGMLQIKNASITGNTSTAGDGGAINMLAGNAEINATISGNASLGGSGGAINAAGGSINIVDSTLSNNRANSSGGGAINVAGATVTLSGDSIESNTSMVGGGIRISSGSVTATTTDITNNYVGTTYDYQGGGVYMTGGTFTFNSGNISDNTAGYGGAIYVNTSTTATVNLNGGLLTRNLAANGSGGALYLNNGGTVTIDGAQLTYNTGNILAGGVYLTGANSSVNMTSGQINNNRSGLTGGGSGAGVYISTGASFEISDGEISNNTGGSNGGGIYIIGGSLTIEGGNISNNTAGQYGNGGGVAVYSGTNSITGGTFNNNTAYDGGGIYGAVAVNLSNITVNGNRATRNGGGLGLAGSGTTSLSNATISQNTAAGAGGGLDKLGAATLTLTNVSLTDNTAGTNGGGINASAGTVILVSGEISGNTAVLGNGAYLPASDRLKLSPTNYSLEFGESDAIYLPENVTFNIGAPLDAGLVADTFVPIAFESANIGDDVAIADSDFIAAYSYLQLKSGNTVFAADGVYIWIVSTLKE